jgi:hypothetical protein
MNYDRVACVYIYHVTVVGRVVVGLEWNSVYIVIVDVK